MNEEKDSLTRCQLILHLILGFAEKNPGITRILNGDALMGEQDRLRAHSKADSETAAGQRERKLREGKTLSADEAIIATMTVTPMIDYHYPQWIYA